MKIDGDIGAKKILQKNKEKVFNLHINDKAIISDFNTPESFKS
jgi:CTP:molybdopterin cytidylyltransferase MocA